VEQVDVAADRAREREGLGLSFTAAPSTAEYPVQAAKALSSSELVHFCSGGKLVTGASRCFPYVPGLAGH